MKSLCAILAVVLGGCMTSSISGSTGQSNAANGSSAGTAAGSGSVGSTGGASGSGGSSTGLAMGTGSTGGACLSLGDTCSSNAACCSGACNGACQQPAGEGCLRDQDCSSANCVNSVCGCAASTQQPNRDGQLVWVSGTCASDADCCNGIKCVIDPLYLSQTGFCCNTAGGACETDGDCCGGDCENGSCACLPSTDFSRPNPLMCQLSTDCCDSVCSQEHLAGGGYCVGGSGQTCDQPYECANANCNGGKCASCSISGGACTTTVDCCPELICGTSLSDWSGEESATPEVVTSCCTPNGTACVLDDPDAGECCGNCSDAGVCSCLSVGEGCRWDEGCCAGATCMLGGRGFPDDLTCCQMDGQVCFSQGDCCSGSCVNEQCACEPSGTPCSAQPGLFAQAGAHACCSGQCSAGGVCL